MYNKTANYNSYYDKSNLNKKFEQLTPSRSNPIIANNSKNIYNDFYERNSIPYSYSWNKNPVVSSPPNYYTVTSNNRVDKILNYIKIIDSDVLLRNTDSYRSLVSKSLERPKTSEHKIKNLRNDEIILSPSSSIKNINGYTPNRL